MIRRPPRSTRTDTLFPYTTLFRSDMQRRNALPQAGGPRDLPNRQVRLVAAGWVIWTPEGAKTTAYIPHSAACAPPRPPNISGSLPSSTGSLSLALALRRWSKFAQTVFQSPRVAPFEYSRSEEHTSELQSLIRTSYA